MDPPKRLHSPELSGLFLYKKELAICYNDFYWRDVMKKTKFILLASVLLLPLATGCSLFKINTDSNSEKGSTSGQSQPSGGGTSETQPSFNYQLAEPNTSFVQRQTKEEVTSDDLFNLNNKVEITIDVDRAEMQKINDDNSSEFEYGSIKPETYRLAKSFNLKLHNGDKVFEWTLENVGIRQKGNTSRTPIFDNQGNIVNQNHYKISFDETFSDKEMYDDEFIAAHKNKEYKDRELLGLSGLDIKWNKVDDSTHIKEFYANLMLRSAGIMAQHVGLGMMKMTYDGNKTADFGLCTIFEQNSKSFVKRAMATPEAYINMPSWADENAGTYGISGKKYGDFYKASYGRGDGASGGPDFTSSSIDGKRLGVKTDIKGFNWPTYERKTNTSDEYNDQLMRDLVGLLNSNNATYSQIEQKVDLKWLAMEEAVMFFLGNPDAMRYNYNNYEVYFRRTDGKMIIIPIDNDRCFGIGNTWTNGANYILSNDATAYSSKSLNGNTQRNPLLNKTIFSNKNNQSKDDYSYCINLIKNSKWVKNETFESFYNIARNTYQGLATFSLDGGNDNRSFASYMQKKLTMIENQGGQGGQTESESSESQGSGQSHGESIPLNANYYLVGSFNNWGHQSHRDNYLMKKVERQDGDFLYCLFKVESCSESEFKLKIAVNGYDSWQEEYGSGENVEGRCYVKKASNLPSIKCPEATIGKYVRFYVSIDDGHYEIYVFDETPFRYLVANLVSVPPSLIINDSTGLFPTSSDRQVYFANLSKAVFDKERSITLRFKFDMEGIEPYYYTIIDDGNGGATIAFDGVVPLKEAKKFTISETTESVDFSVNIITGEVIFLELGNN